MCACACVCYFLLSLVWLAIATGSKFRTLSWRNEIGEDGGKRRLKWFHLLCSWGCCAFSVVLMAVGRKRKTWVSHPLQFSPALSAFFFFLTSSGSHLSVRSSRYFLLFVLCFFSFVLVFCSICVWFGSQQNKTKTKESSMRLLAHFAPWICLFFFSFVGIILLLYSISQLIYQCSMAFSRVSGEIRLNGCSAMWARKDWTRLFSAKVIL